MPSIFFKPNNLDSEASLANKEILEKRRRFYFYLYFPCFMLNMYLELYEE